MSLVRVLRTAQVTLTHTFYVDETPTDAAGNVTATLKRLDGTTVNTATAGHPGPPGVYTYTVPGQALLDSLTLDWTGTVAGAAVSVRDHVEIVGGFYFGLAEAREAHQSLANQTKYPTDLLAAKRIEVEQECDRICGTAFVPRFTRVALTGHGRHDLLLPHGEPRTLRAVSVDGAAVDLATVSLSPSGVLSRSGVLWPAAARVIVEYEYGSDLPPEEIRSAAVLRLRSILSTTTTGVPDRAVSYTVQDGGVYRLSTPSGARTGVPTVDGVYERYTLELGSFA